MISRSSSSHHSTAEMSSKSKSTLHRAQHHHPFLVSTPPTRKTFSFIFSSFLFFFYFLCSLLLCNVCAIATAQTTTTTLVDGCALAATYDRHSTLAIQINTTNVSLRSPPHTTKVQFVDCVLPKYVNVKIVLPPASFEFDDYNELLKDEVLIEVLNTTMHEGWFKIVPSGRSRAPSGLLFTHRVRVVIGDGSVMHAVDDVLVVDTSSFGEAIVANIFMEIRNAVATSRAGRVASIVTAEGSTVRNAHIRVLGDTILEAKTLLATIVAMRVVDSSLMGLTAPTNCSSTGGGPIRLAARDSLAQLTVGVLSILPVTTGVSSVLFVENVAIRVSSVWAEDTPLDDGGHHDTTNSSSSSSSWCAAKSNAISMVAFTRRTIAATASIVVRHPDYAQLFMSGSVVVSVELDDLAAQHELTATVELPLSVSAVGSIAAIAYDNSKYSASRSHVALDNASLSLSFVANAKTHSPPAVAETNNKKTSRIDVKATANSMCISAVFGITVFSLSSAGVSDSELKVSNGSCVSFFVDARLDSTALSSLTVGSYCAASLLGIAKYSISSYSAPTTTLSISSDSRISITGLLEGPATTLMATVASYGAVSVLGLVTSATSNSYTRGIANTTVNGSVTIKAIVSEGAQLNAAIFHPKSAAGATLGVSVYGKAAGTFRLGQRGAQLKIWVGAREGSRVSTSAAATSVLIGLSFDTLFPDKPPNSSNDVEKNSSAINVFFCTDGTAKLSAPGGTSVGIAPPSANGTTVQTVQTWTSSDNSSSSSDCTAVATELLETPLPTCTTDRNRPVAPRWHTETLSPSRQSSATSSFFTPSISSTPPTPSNTETDWPPPTFTHTHSPSLRLSQQTSTTPSTMNPSSTLSTTVPVIEVFPATDSPSPRKRSVSIATSVLLPGNQEAATTVLATAGASGAVAATLGSSGGGAMVVAGSSVRMMECGLADDDPRPASFELPIQFALGDGSMQYFAGAALSHTLLQCFLFGLPFLVRRCQHNRKQSTALTYVSMAFCGAHAFFTPAILGACSTVLFNSGTDDEAKEQVGKAVAGCCATVVVAMNTVIVLAVHGGPRNGIVAKPSKQQRSSRDLKLVFQLSRSSSRTTTTTTTTTTSTSSSSRRSRSDSLDSVSSTVSSSTSGSSNTVSSSSYQYSKNERTLFLISGEDTLAVLLTLFDGCRVYEKATHRHYASIETTLFSIISIVSGARPRSHCNYAAFAIGGIALAHLLYIVVVRPLRTRLDTVFSVVNSVLLVVLSLSVAVALNADVGEEDSGTPQWAAKTMVACLWLISVLGFVQLGVQGFWAYHVQQRRQTLLEHVAAVDDSGGDSGSSECDMMPSEEDGHALAEMAFAPENPMNEPLLRVLEPFQAGDDDGIAVRKRPQNIFS